MQHSQGESPLSRGWGGAGEMSGQDNKIQENKCGELRTHLKLLIARRKFLHNVLEDTKVDSEAAPCITCNVLHLKNSLSNEPHH